MIFFDRIRIKEASTLGVPKEFEVAGGLTKREFFAGLALQGYLSNSEWYGILIREFKESKIPATCQAAKYAVLAADALIMELECRKPIK